MKKNVTIAASLAVSFLLTTTSLAQITALAAENSMGSIYNLKINGELVDSDVPPAVDSNEQLIPVRAVFEKLGGTVNWDNTLQRMSIVLGSTNIELRANSRIAKLNNRAIRLETPPKMVNSRLMLPTSFMNNQLNMKVATFPKESLITIDSEGKLKDVSYLKNGGADQVVVSMDGNSEYKIMRLTGPDRIVIDFPGISVVEQTKEKKIDVGGNFVKSIRYSQYESNTARVVLDVAGQPQYKVEQKDGSLYLNIESSPFRNVIYYSNYDRVYFSLNGAKLTEGGENLRKLYTEKYENDGKLYTMTFPSNLAKLESGTLDINDGYLNSIKIVKNEKGDQTSIIFDAKSKFSYLTMTRPEVGGTAITILKPATMDEKLIVIDPGHGGVDPGAVYAGIKEKDLNLDIALRLNNLLKSKNVKTYILREDDSFVGLYERGYIANNLNASLFLSIHNNALGNSNYGGTMTLYYPQKTGSTEFNGKKFAQTIQDRLLNGLKTTNRNIIERPNLVVLKSTVMPAALAEIAFMTNPTDLGNLKRPEFRQSAASALYDAVIESLKAVK